jgi:hypothetical protein
MQIRTPPARGAIHVSVGSQTATRYGLERTVGANSDQRGRGVPASTSRSRRPDAARTRRRWPRRQGAAAEAHVIRLTGQPARPGPVGPIVGPNAPDNAGFRRLPRASAPHPRPMNTGRTGYRAVASMRFTRERTVVRDHPRPYGWYAGIRGVTEAELGAGRGGRGARLGQTLGRSGSSANRISFHTRSKSMRCRWMTRELARTIA